MNRRDRLLEDLVDSQKKIIIWGARMTGIGALRQLKKKKIEVAGFIDSDPSLINKFVHGYEVKNPEDLKKILEIEKNLLILLAVSIKEEEILHQLNSMGIKNLDVKSFFDEDAPYYTIDILGSCNLKCISCPHSIIDSKVPKGSMKLDTFKLVFDKILEDSPQTSHISLYSWGEPLLHPYISEIIDYVHEKNVSVALSSNLSIKFDDRIKKIIKSQPDYLKVSLSGYYPKAYNNTHSGGDIELVKKNLYLIKEHIDYYNAPTLVDINYHLYKDNAGENLAKMQNLAESLGFVLSKTYALVMPLERVLSHLDGKPDIQTKLLQENLLVTIDEGIQASSKVKLSNGSCPFRENQVNINSDLTVPVCCTVWERGDNVVVNNFLKSSLDEINRNKKKVELCKKCMNLRLPEYNMGFNKKGWKNFADQKTIIDIGSKE